MNKFNNILETIGNTPHVKINKLFGPDANVYIKLERANPGASIKDIIALAMIEDAEKSGKLKPNSVIIEATSGNTGIGLAMVAVGLLLSQRSVIAVTKKGLPGVSFALRVENLLGC